jgi:hypothetical protein
MMGVLRTGSRLTLIALAAVSVAGLGLTGARAAGGPAAPDATAAWSVQPTPAIHQPAGNLQSTSCSSASFCMSVGTAPGGGPEAAAWNGTDWQPEPLPSAGRDYDLAAVSCTSAVYCVAVGGIRASTTSAAVTATWDGTGWTVQRPSHQGFLEGVSCPSASACLAVGGAEQSSDSPPLVERLTGQTWSTVTQPSQTLEGNLDAVSCSSASACTATGNRLTQSAPLVERWDGTSLAVQQAAQPPGGNGPLTGVSCPDQSYCLAVGNTGDSPPYARPPYIEDWDGTTWSVMRSPAVAGSLAGVSCSAANACIAVGSTAGTAGGALADEYGSAMAFRLSGQAWGAQLASSPAGSLASELAGVSCPQASQCMAAGFSDGPQRNQTALAESWGGSQWTLWPVPSGKVRAAGSFAGVSCAGPADCTAVGSMSSSDGSTVPLGESWDGSGWTASKLRPAGQFTFADGVSCPAAKTCLAVGSHQHDGPGSASSPWAADWNGSRWVTLSPPRPAGSDDSTGLSAVSCVSATSCIAAGDVSAAPAAYAWDGTGWTRLAVPAASGVLTGVSCASATSCVAVGRSFDGSSWLADAWDGTAWTALPTSGNLAINAVSCSSAVACTAVGSQNTGLNAQQVIERWDGTAWTAQQPAPPSAGNGHAQLNGVSCAAATACTAAGYFYMAGTAGQKHTVRQSFVQTWNGSTWTAGQTPSFRVSALTSVSCTAEACTVAGLMQAPNREEPLADRAG